MYTAISGMLMAALAATPAGGAPGTSPEARQVQQWIDALGAAVDSAPPREEAPAVRIVEARQDYRAPTPDVCCHTGTPLRIGSQSYEKGIGAHANGRIAVALSGDFVRFCAEAGVDNNEDTRGERGSVQFAVAVDGAERFRSPVLRGGGEPVPVEVDVSGASRLELIVEDAGDGYRYDQADWAVAALETASGERVYLGDVFETAGGEGFAGAPTGFTYGGADFAALCGRWDRRVEELERLPGMRRHSVTWAEPGTGFEATLLVTEFDAPAAVELQWRFTNTGVEPSAVIADVRSVDLRAPAEKGRAELVSCRGGTTGNLAHQPGFELSRTPLGSRSLSVEGGRSSNGDLPFFLLSGLRGAWGVACGLGWSGAWQADARFDEGVETAQVRAGMTPCRFRLPAGESVTLPAALVAPFKGPASTGGNRIRRLLREHYQGRLGGREVLPPVSFSTWFVFHNDIDAPLLAELAREAADLGIEYFCVDAGWFDGAFPYGVGNWTVDAAKFPEGLEPVAAEVHRLGMKFGLWFEPERVTAGTRWAEEHPELLYGGGGSEKAGARALLDLGKPAARDLVLSMMSPIIERVGVDWIRFDFNIAPGPIWAEAEGDDEQGLSQIRYMNGLYALLRELMRRHPDLLIEQCASGGRRIDLETIRLGHTFWKSDDTFDQPLMRFHETGGNFFLLAGHLNTNYCRFRSEGELLALFAGCLGFGADLRALDADQKDAIRRAIAAYKEVRGYLNRDYYGLFEQATSETGWAGWEFIAPEDGQGCFIVYRPERSPYARAAVRLEGLQPERRYRLREAMTGEEGVATGAELAATFTLDVEPGGAQVWRFEAEEAR
ncbi:MAG: alpha-galactosidase [Candidatus Hydrogenedentes bacterium]|nr:alpha-galactosidase [Candidatus Hydrogenedentota bacterium]